MTLKKATEAELKRLSDCLLTKSTKITDIELSKIPRRGGEAPKIVKFSLQGLGPSDLSSLVITGVNLLTPISILSYMNLTRLSLHRCRMSKISGEHLGKLVRDSQVLQVISFIP